MGWRFRKTVRFSRWLRVNVSGSGVSLGLGPPGANINIGPRGVRQTIGLPGSGISHQTFTKWPSPQSAAGQAPQPGDGSLPPSVPPPSAPAPVPGSNLARNLAIAGGVIVLVGWIAWPGDRRPSARVATLATGTPPAASSAAEPVRPAMPPPAANRALTPDEVREAQTLLKALGFDAGAADGLVGPNTIAAVKRYEPSRGWPASGEVDLRLLESLRASKAAPSSPTSAPPTIKPSPAAPPAATSAAPSPSSPPVTVVPSDEMRLATRVIRAAEHPCPLVAAAVRLSDGSVRAVCSNSEIYRVMQVRGEWVALRCSAAERAGVKGC